MKILKIKKYLANKKWQSICILLLIIGVGTFLRTEHFHDWVRFNGDQARDAAVIDTAISNGDIPLLGPRAGGTSFKLGPAFYYFQYSAAIIFGNRPDVIAYPTLLFGILSIPLLYLLLKRIFVNKISLVVTGLFSFSVFAIKYSRFAWNPNLVPFFVFLTIFLLPMALGFSANKYRKLSAAGVGLSAGIAFQLHTLLMVLIPIVIAFVAFRTKMQKGKILFPILIIIFLGITVNLPQIYYEIQSNGANSRQFIQGIDQKTDKNESIVGKAMVVTECFVKSNYYIISASGGNDGCGFFKKGKATSSSEFYLRIILSIIFLSGGIFFAFRAWQKEKDPGKRLFLETILIMVIAAYAMFIPFAEDVSMRYFLVIFFWPFVLVGFWIEKIIESMKKIGYVLVACLILVFVVTNMRTYHQTFPAKVGESDMRSEFYGGIRLGDAEGGADYIVEKAKKYESESSKVYIGSFEYNQSLSYLIRKKSKLNVSFLEDWPPKEKIPFYFMKRTESAQKILNKKFNDFSVVDSRNFERYSIFQAVPK